MAIWQYNLDCLLLGWKKQTDLSTRWGYCWLYAWGESILKSLHSKGLWLQMFQKERKKSFMSLHYNLAVHFQFCRFASRPNIANCFCQCFCNVPRKQFHKCCSWKGCADNISSARLTAHSYTHSHHQQPYSFTRALTQKPKHSADDHSATLVNNKSQVPLDLVSGLVWLFWSLASAGTVHLQNGIEMIQFGKK